MRRFLFSTLRILIVFVLSLSLLVPLVQPEVAHAQLPVTITTSAPDAAKTIFDQIMSGLKSAVLSAASRILTYAVRKISYDSAVWIASGGKGQSALVFNKGWGNYLNNVADNALGQGIEQLGKPFGFNLCKLPDIKTDLALRVGLRTGFQGIGIGAGYNKPGTSCTFTQFTKNWSDGKGWESKFNAAQQSIADQLNNALDFTPQGQGGLLTVLDTTERLKNEVQQTVQSNQLDRQEGEGFKSSRTPVSDDIKIPGKQIQKESLNNTPGDTQKSDEQLMQQLLTTGDIKVIPNVLSMFLNTLVSSMVKNYQEKGILPFGLGCKDGSQNCIGGSSAVTFEGAGVTGGRAAAQNLFADFLTVKIPDPQEYDLLAQLGNCEARGTYNCRADQGLIQAARETAGGEPVTIQQAIDRNLLNGNWQLIPPSRAADNADLKNFCQKAYCYSNVQVLRQVRLLPLGFQIAAAESDPDRPWTLAQVVKGFNECEYTTDSQGNKVVRYNPAKFPFCHLIDPNWVIKIPESRCKALVNSSVQLASDVPTRIQECADLQSCVAYDKKGNCVNYAYCTREKNSWDFADADTCDAQFATCKTFTNQATGDTVNYLYRTLDTQSCSQTDAGCQAYSIMQPRTNRTWLPVQKITQANNFMQSGVHFNNQLPSSCSANSDGCSAFQVASSTPGDLRFLRKAPDYLGCYDANLQQSGVQWPKTVADLNGLSTDEVCKPYAQACIADEVGCAKYTNKGTNESIPGKIGQDNVCASECVGYNAYEEMPSAYSNGESVAYAVIQPNQGPVCAKEEVGCSSFTNLGTDVGGQEKVEYFAFLQPCELPNKKPSKTYTTFEGSKNGGYQLFTYTLVADQNGAPAQWSKNPADLANLTNNVNGCTEALYKQKKAHPDCHQFNDEAGNAYYARLDRTIPISNVCTPYRLNTSELDNTPNAINDANSCANAKGSWDANSNTCQFCFQNGEFTNGFCTYWGLPGGEKVSGAQSNTCSAAVESCRAYRGNDGYNVQTILSDTFESTTTLQSAQWTVPDQRITAVVSGESTQPGGHSLSVFGTPQAITTAIRLIPAGSSGLVIGEFYSVSFWAKSSPATDLTVTLADGANQWNATLGTQTIGDVWRYYTVGPIAFNGTTADAKITFAAATNVGLFIDNVAVQKLGEMQYRIKNKLTIPTTCDADQTDNLPGAALGCSMYTRNRGQSNVQDVALTGFDFICREKAIGCTAFVDTYNTLTDGRVTLEDQGPRLYQVWLPGDAQGAPAEWKLYYNNTSVGSCRTKQGEYGCYVKMISNIEPSDLLANASVNGDGVTRPEFTPSTIYIPGDSPSAVFLVNNPNQPGQCRQTDMGCTLAGAEIHTPASITFVTTTIKNDPALYDTTLCKNEAVGCMVWNDTNGGTAFFKDPKTTGGKVCEYKSSIPLPSGSTGSGWFWQGVGQCSQGGATCSADADCGAGDTCQDIGTVPCYPTYIDGTGSYGIWSSGNTTTYKGYVGVCPAEQNMCTELIDHSDVDQNGLPHSYYFLRNGKISDQDCNGSVSRKNGCVLFDQADKPEKYWSTNATYDASDKIDGQAIPPLSSEPNDANTILKVRPNRVCGEWLQCRRSYTVWDPASNKPKSVCQQIGRCNYADPNNPSECGQGGWVDNSSDVSGATLSQKTYVERSAKWSSQDFDGYSILDQYPVEEMTQINGSASLTTPDWHLVKLVPCGGGEECSDKNPNSQAVACAKLDAGGQPIKQDGTVACGRSNEGVCLNYYCSRPITGVNNKDVANQLDLQKQICRGYPETDSPFPNTPLVGLPFSSDSQSSQAFSQVHVCQERSRSTSNMSEAFACECDYTKATYGDSLVKYWNYKAPAKIEPLTKPDGSVQNYGSNGPEGICIGGGVSNPGANPLLNRDGQWCATDDDCKVIGNGNKVLSAGTCQIQKKLVRFLGWRGYCLEYDTSRTINGDPNQHPCLSWYPIDTLTGAPDINSEHLEAGFTPNGGQSYYCFAGNGGAEVNVNQSQDWLLSPVGILSNLQGYYVAKASFESYIESYPPEGHQLAHGQGDAWQTACTFCLGTGDIDPTSCGICHNTGKTTANSDNNYVGTPFEKYGAPYMEVNSFKISGQMVRGEYPGDSAVKLQDLEKIIITVGDASDDEDPPQNTQFEIYPTDFAAGDGLPQAVYKMHTKNGKDGRAATGRYLGRAHQFVLFYGGAWDDHPPYLNDAGDQVCYGQNQGCGSLGGNIFKVDGLTRPLGSEGIWNDKSITRNDQLCPQDSGSGNWHAIRLRFDPTTGVYQGYDTAYCDDSGGSGEIKYNVVFRRKEWCPVVADASVAPNAPWANSTVAWTNRLWRDNPAHQSFAYSADGNPAAQFVISYNTANTDYGNVSYTGNLGPRQIFLTVQQYTADDRCNGSDIGCTHKLNDPNDPISKAMNGAPYSCEAFNCVRTEPNNDPNKSGAVAIAPTKLAARARQNLGHLFAKFQNIWTFDPSISLAGFAGYQAGVDSAGINGYTEIGDPVTNKKPNAPSVNPLIPNSCRSDGQCAEDVKYPNNNSITINDKSSGFVKVFNGASKVFIKFYMHADDDQMPIRAVSVDWYGDGRDVLTRQGYFYNQRGLVQEKCDVANLGGKSPANNTKCAYTIGQRGNAPGITVDTKQSCKNDRDCQSFYAEQCTDPNSEYPPPLFGYIKSRDSQNHITCSNNYYQADNVFTCVSHGDGWVPKEQCGDNPDEFPEGCCIYHPRVQVKDNWGWCNAGDGQGNNACNNEAQGCYGGTANELARGICDDARAWAQFRGDVLVAPSQ